MRVAREELCKHVLRQEGVYKCLSGSALSAPPRAGGRPHAVNCPVARGPPAVGTTHTTLVSDSGVRGCAQAPVSPQCLGLCLHTIPAGRAEPQPPESGLPSLRRGRVGEEGVPGVHRPGSPGDGPWDPSQSCLASARGHFREVWVMGPNCLGPRPAEGSPAAPPARARQCLASHWLLCVFSQD